LRSPCVYAAIAAIDPRYEIDDTLPLLQRVLSYSVAAHAHPAQRWVNGVPKDGRARHPGMPAAAACGRQRALQLVLTLALYLCYAV
jgi:hypothetical protein